MYWAANIFVKADIIGNMATKTYFEMERFFQALGDRTRLRLLNLMGEQEICVCYFVEILGQPQPKISRHLAYLRKRGTGGGATRGQMDALPAGNAATCRGCPDSARDAGMDERDKAMQADRSRLIKACCAPEKFVSLEGAPRPSQVDAAGCEVC